MRIPEILQKDAKVAKGRNNPGAKKHGYIRIFRSLFAPFASFCKKSSPGFVLVEVLLGVSIFAIGVLALGRCVSNCVIAESARQETERSRLALENRMAEVEAGEIPTDKDRSDDLGDDFPGMTMKQSRRPIAAKNEKNADILGLYDVDLEVDWTSDNQPQSRSVSFYVLRSR